MGDLVITRGCAALREALKAKSYRVLAKLLSTPEKKISHVKVFNLSRGEVQPTLAEALRLRDVLGIHVEWWAQTPTPEEQHAA